MSIKRPVTIQCFVGSLLMTNRKFLPSVPVLIGSVPHPLSIYAPHHTTIYSFNSARYVLGYFWGDQTFPVAVCLMLALTKGEVLPTARSMTTLLQNAMGMFNMRANVQIQTHSLPRTDFLVLPSKQTSELCFL